MYQDRDQSCSPPSKQARKEEKGTQRNRAIKLKRSFTSLKAFPPHLHKTCPVFARRPTVLLYVRTGTEEVFDALMLSTPTLSGLREAVSDTNRVALSPHVICHAYRLSLSQRLC